MVGYTYHAQIRQLPDFRLGGEQRTSDTHLILSTSLAGLEMPESHQLIDHGEQYYFPYNGMSINVTLHPAVTIYGPGAPSSHREDVISSLWLALICTGLDSESHSSSTWSSSQSQE
jgi:hypothetical protein